MADIILKTLTPATNFDLISLADLKTKLGIASADTTQDAQLSLLITAYSDVIATLCNRVFAKEQMAETWRDLDSNRVFLSHYPIDAEADVVSVECPRGTALDPTTYEIELKSGKIELMTEQTEPILVTYTGGYDLPDDAPPALQEALAMIIREQRALSQRLQNAGVRSLSHKETRVVYFDIAKTQAAGGVVSGGSTIAIAAPVYALLMHYVRLQV